jgi:hypothetical protein
MDEEEVRVISLDADLGDYRGMRILPTTMRILLGQYRDYLQRWGRTAFTCYICIGESTWQEPC